MPIEKKADAEPIRGYRLIERLGAGGFGEVWKCEAPGGIFKAIKFVYGSLNGLEADSARADEELRAFQLIKSIRHPFLLSIDRVENVGGELLIVTELADQNLADLGAAYRAQGLAGIPRAELLSLLREAAEVLDLLNQKFDLQHLDIKPHNLFLVSHHVKLADFGLVNRLTSGTGNQAPASMGAVTPLYAAPELFQGKISRHSDQYSLAIVYQELLTGTLPFDGKNLRQLLVQHTQQPPDLRAVPEADRPTLARALAKDPTQRFPSCLALIQALQADGPARRPDTDPEVALAASVDTVVAAGPTTQRLRLPALPTLPDGVLTGYRFQQALARGPLLEIWLAQTPDNAPRHVQFLYGFSGHETKRLKEAMTRLQSVQHPALVSPTVAHVEPGRLVLVCDAYKETVRDRFAQCVSRKKPGIPRGELVDNLRAAAEVLDYLAHQHNVQHLNLNPRLLVLDHGWLQLAEFGYAHLLWLPFGQDVSRRNVRYSAPELIDGTVSRACDQYSLALIYAEMLSGVHPFGGQNRAAAVPDLARLPAWDRDVIARALHADPAQRWPSCTEMLLALEGTSPEMLAQLSSRPDHFVTLVEKEKQRAPSDEAPIAPPAELNQILSALIHGVEGTGEFDTSLPPLDATDEGLRHQFQVGLPLGTARAKLDEYAGQSYGQVVAADDAGLTLRLTLAGDFWQRLLKRIPHVELEVRLARCNPMLATPIEVTATVRTQHCRPERSRQLLEELGPNLLEGLQKLLLVNSEKRMQDRLLWPQQVTVIPVHRGGHQEEPIVCRGKDLSMTGVGFYLPHELSTSEVLIELPNPLRPPTVLVPATLVRAKRCADGWYEVGAIFHLASLRRSLPELCLAAH